MAKPTIKLMRPDARETSSSSILLDSNTPYHKFFQLNKIAKALGIKKDKVYNNFNGDYNSLDNGGDRKRIAKFMLPHAKAFFEKLGFKITAEPIN
jgi:hypothetical protein